MWYNTKGALISLSHGFIKYQAPTTFSAPLFYHILLSLSTSVFIYVVLSTSCPSVAFRCRNRFLHPEAVYRYREWVKKRLKKKNATILFTISAFFFLLCAKGDSPVTTPFLVIDSSPGASSEAHRQAAPAS
ncbi:MAG: hypothetical protein ACI4RU_04630, partial [Acutalibacteraceae bacterium]